MLRASKTVRLYQHQAQERALRQAPTMGVGFYADHLIQNHTIHHDQRRTVQGNQVAHPSHQVKRTSQTPR